MASAYAYAEGGQQSHEIMLGQLINRFGVEAITGKPVLDVGLARCIMRAERIEQAYRSRQEMENWAAWASDNPEENKILNQAMLAAEEIKYAK